jgi:molybdate transport system permease protein
MSGFWSALWPSLRVAGPAIAIALAAGVWLAWLFVNRQVPGKRVLVALAAAALALPSPIVCCYLFWSFTPARVLIAGVLSAAPLIGWFAHKAFSSLNPVHAKAARGMGASEVRVLARIELPLTGRTILAGACIAFAKIMAELAIAEVLGTL